MKEQRLNNLQQNLWSYLATNKAIDLSQWQKKVDGVEKNSPGIAIDSIKLMEISFKHILEKPFPRASKALHERHPDFYAMIPHIREEVTQFVDSKQSDWDLHYELAFEAFEFFLTSPTVEDIRRRLMFVLWHPSQIKVIPGTIELIVQAYQSEDLNKVRAAISTHSSACLSLIFLTVDWSKTPADESRRSYQAKQPTRPKTGSLKGGGW